MSHQIEFCKKCVNKSFSSSQGIICGLTNEKPTFQFTCPDFVKDVKEERRLAERAAVQDETHSYEDAQGSSTPVWKTILGIIIFIVAIIRLVAVFAR
ncbi:hypothetical protein IMCC3317_36580 [Kordia antarctica]|uniref:Uncharacterized protein n=1 Tax=Kordia antarctica TaxID=1218801 RepID=A0A7L4ZNG0_9FLAO|nr:hypothetical protein [Kordia antarctica]QHI38268.1 hypothetical protein IMCC3317_36580 [Kordia antarctica]